MRQDVAKTMLEGETEFNTSKHGEIDEIRAKDLKTNKENKVMIDTYDLLKI